MFSRVHRIALLAGVAALFPAHLAAQETGNSDPAVAPPPQAAAAGNRRVYMPADFTRFAPKSAFDMLSQVPGFTIRSADNERGLGQASENVLINGQRITDKSASAVSQLQNTPAGNVERIEIVDASTLGIAGLTGSVANVITKVVKKGTGSFQYRPEARAHYSYPIYGRGKISWNDVAGPFDYTLTMDSSSSGNGAFGEGEFVIRNSNGLVENRDSVFKSKFFQPRFIARTKIDLPGSAVANASVNYAPYWYKQRNPARVTLSDGNDYDRDLLQKQVGFIIDFNGDVEFAAGPGRLKLIGLRHFEHEPTITTLTFDYLSDAPTDGIRFTRDAFIGETVGRAEYKWKTGKNDWQVSFERAYNSLRQDGQLLSLDPDSGDYINIPDGARSGEVNEVRYEGIASFSRPLTSKLDLQLSGGGEISKLTRVDGDLEPRKFFRPKGSIVLGWRPAKGWDTSLSLKRRVGQISFYDFLAQPNLNQDRENAGNNDLVPPQSWELETEVNKDLGVWGKTKLRAYVHRIDDIVDIVPIGDDGESVGNLPRAKLWGLESTSTIQFDPLGWKGAKLDLTLSKEHSSVEDPLTGETRPISGASRYGIEASLRHDIPGTQIAWGGFFEKYKSYDTYFLTEIGNGWEGPFVGGFIEHKDVLGMKVRFDVVNVTGGRHYFWRDVYDGRRNVAPLLYTQREAEKIGPIFRLDIRGNF